MWSPVTWGKIFFFSKVKYGHFSHTHTHTMNVVIRVAGWVIPNEVRNEFGIYCKETKRFDEQKRVIKLCNIYFHMAHYHKLILKKYCKVFLEFCLVFSFVWRNEMEIMAPIWFSDPSGQLCYWLPKRK